MFIVCLHVSIQWIYTCTRCHELFQPVSFAVLRHSQWTCMRGLDIWVYTIIYVHVRMYYDRAIKSTVIAWYCIRTIHTLYLMCFNVYIYIYIYRWLLVCCDFTVAYLKLHVTMYFCFCLHVMANIASCCRTVCDSMLVARSYLVTGMTDSTHIQTLWRICSTPVVLVYLEKTDCKRNLVCNLQDIHQHDGIDFLSVMCPSKCGVYVLYEFSQDFLQA